MMKCLIKCLAHSVWENSVYSKRGIFTPQRKLTMKIMAIDLGLKRIGLAFSAHASVVTPLQAVARKNRNQASSAVRALIDEWEAEAIVVGIAMGGSSEEEMRRRAAHFIKLLAFDGPVYYQDESDTSLEAQERMKGSIRYKRDGRIDSLSAMIILERYLAEQDNGHL
jgi:putative Holliday junction resolvase